MPKMHISGNGGHLEFLRCMEKSYLVFNIELPSNLCHLNNSTCTVVVIQVIISSKIPKPRRHLGFLQVPGYSVDRRQFLMSFSDSAQNFALQTTHPKRILDNMVRFTHP